MKIDPYINVDAGTMNPVEHGEVFVTEDGDETDQDIGNYERFLDENIYSDNYMTTGRVYLTVIQKERNLEYDGKCVEVVPDIPEEVIRRISRAGKKAKADFVIDGNRRNSRRVSEHLVFGSRQNAPPAASAKRPFCFGKLSADSQKSEK